MSYFLSQTIEPISFLIYLVAFYVYAKKIKGSLHYWIVTLYYFLATIILFRASLRLEGDTSNNYYYNLLYLITSIGLSYYFFALFQARGKKVTAILVCLTTIVYYFSNLDQIYFDSIGYVIASIGIVITIFLFLHQLMSHVTEQPISNNFDFWYTCIQLVYQLGAFAIFLSYNYFTHRFFETPDNNYGIGIMLAHLWVVHNILLFSGAIVTVYAVMRMYRTKLLKD
jgi:hypothetical protein